MDGFQAFLILIIAVCGIGLMFLANEPAPRRREGDES